MVYPHFLNPMLSFYDNTPMQPTGAIGPSGPSVKRMISPTFSRSAGLARIEPAGPQIQQQFVNQF